MNWLDRVVGTISPRAGLRRVQARQALDVLAHYKAASVSRRAPSVRPRGGDADSVAEGFRRQVALSVRDVVRNNPLAERALTVLVNNIVGTGIEPKLVSDDERLVADWPAIDAALDSTQVDADGSATLAGLQRTAVRAMIMDGECFVVWFKERGGAVPRLRVLEADYLDDRHTGQAENPANMLYDGIEYGPDGRVVAYHLYDEHPGTAAWFPGRHSLESTRIEADRVVHLYRVDRPGQRRGVSWFAPVLEDLVALAENDDAQLMRQRIAACFVGTWRSDREGTSVGIPTTIAPGMIHQIASDEELTFAQPPDVTGYDDFARIHLRRIAMGLGITYESLTGDLTGVNFSSARIGRMEMGLNVEAWQWTLVMPVLCARMGNWLRQGWAYAEPDRAAAVLDARIDWTPPPPVIADPKLETQVAVMKVESGLSSRPSEIRKLGYDPAKIDAEITKDADMRRSLSAMQAPPRETAPEPSPQEGIPDGR